MSYLTTILVVAVGIVFGFLTETITEVTLWIVGGLYGGYVAANVLKWHWWRFNGFGFFWGMIIGTLGALIIPPIVERLWPGTNTLYAFPAIFLFSVLGCFLGTLLSKPEDEEILKKFYMSIHPWGFWKPIANKVLAEQPGFNPITDCARHWFNVIVGIIWQITLVALPVYIIIQESRGVISTLVILVTTTLILKKSWFDHLPNYNNKAPAHTE
ncbi:MAG: hypothetical protein ACYS80_08470 [Planctomycetota bacterium]|jgi:hypothetical protein